MNNNYQIKRIFNDIDKVLLSYNTGRNKSISKEEKENYYIQKLEEKSFDFIQESFEAYYNIIKDVPRENRGDNLNDNLNERHLKKFLKRFNLKVSPKIMDSIHSEYIIEVYANNHQQLFRSINFFNLSSYSLSTLVFLPWVELYYRREKDARELLSYASYVIENDTEILAPKNATHILTELETQKKFKYSLEYIGNCVDEQSNLTVGYITLIKVSKCTSRLNLVS